MLMLYDLEVVTNAFDESTCNAKCELRKKASYTIGRAEKFTLQKARSIARKEKLRLDRTASSAESPLSCKVKRTVYCLLALHTCV